MGLNCLLLTSDGDAAGDHPEGSFARRASNLEMRTDAASAIETLSLGGTSMASSLTAMVISGSHGSARPRYVAVAPTGTSVVVGRRERHNQRERGRLMREPNFVLGKAGSGISNCKSLLDRRRFPRWKREAPQIFSPQG